MKTVILVGGGRSLREQWENGIYEKIRGYEVWSLNFAWKTMPYLPSRQLFVDKSFYKNNLDDIQKLHEQGVPLTAKWHTQYAFLGNFIEQYKIHNDREKYSGREALKTENKFLYTGLMGLCGTFAISYAIARGYEKIYLLGYDFGTPTAGDRVTHYYQEEIPDLKIKSKGAGRTTVYREKDGKLKDKVKDYQVFLQVKDVEIINVSPLSNITYFKKITYEQFYEEIICTKEQ